MTISPSFPGNADHHDPAPLQGLLQDEHRGRAGGENPSGRSRMNSRSPRPTSRAHTTDGEPLTAGRRASSKSLLPNFPRRMQTIQGQATLSTERVDNEITRSVGAMPIVPLPPWATGIMPIEHRDIVQQALAVV